MRAFLILPPLPQEERFAMRRRHRAIIVWLLVVLMSVPPSRLYSLLPAPSATDTSGKPKPDLGHITPETTATVIAYPRHVLTAPEMEMLPIEVLSAAAKKELGIDPVEIEQAILIAEPPLGGPPQVALALHFNSPMAEGKILSPLWERTVAGDLDGKKYRRGQGPMDLSIFSPDQRTLLVGTDDLLRRMVANHANPQSGKMSQTLGKAPTPPDICPWCWSSRSARWRRWPWRCSFRPRWLT